MQGMSAGRLGNAVTMREGKMSEADDGCDVGEAVVLVLEYKCTTVYSLGVAMKYKFTLEVGVKYCSKMCNGLMKREKME